MERDPNMQLARAAWIGLALILSPVQRAEAATPPATSTQLILIGEHRIAFHVTPGHLPIIVLDAGGGEDSSYWAALAPELWKRTGSEIITYDRAGMGASDEVAGPWKIDNAVADLAIGLKRLGATHDVILVSHSLAGEIATYLAREHPGWISGAVLVDANVPQFFTDSEVARQASANAPLITSIKAVSPTKGTRQLLALASTFVETSRAFHKVSWPKTIPCIVIVSEKTPFDTASDAQLWREAHSRFANAASNRRLIVAERSSHDVAHDRPDIVIQAIADMAARPPSEAGPLAP